MTTVLVIIILLALIFDISNGWHDCANAIATVVSTRVLTPRQAVFIAAGLNIFGAFLSTAVAKTIGTGIVDAKSVTEAVIISALLASIVWNIITTLMGIPVSSSHALIGSLIGSSFAHGGLETLKPAGILKIFGSLLASPFIGLIIGYFVMKLVLKFFGTHSPGWLNRNFGRMQIFSSSIMALSHGSNDAQKVMGIITLSLFSGGVISSVDVPTWVVGLCAVAMGIGTAMGGWRVIKTLGVHMLKLEPVHGFAAETAAGAVILSASHLGLPVSTTHVISSSIMGVGATKRLTAVRWGVAGKIVLAWVLTLPFCAVLAWVLYHIVGPLVLR